MNRLDSRYADLSNAWGGLTMDIIERLEAFFDNPCAATWDDIHCIIIDERLFTTVWQAVIAVDPTFPRNARLTETRDGFINRWERIPDFFTVRRAIKHVQNKIREEIEHD